MKRVLYFTNYPSPYRVKFFSELGKSCDLTVLFEETPEEQKHRDSSWFERDYSNFNAVFLKRKNVLGKKISTETIKWIKKKFDRIVVGVYSSPTAQLAILYMKLHKIPFYIETDGGYKKSGKGLSEKWKKFLISSASAWISPSTLSDEYLAFYGAKTEKIVRYPFTSFSSSDVIEKIPSAEEKKELRKELGLKGEHVVVSVGQFIPRKGNDVLIKAAKKLPESTQVYLIGGNPPEEYYTLLKENKIENVHFVPFKRKEVLKKYYLAADVLAFPTREDIWGLVINEAMANGLPVVSTDRCIAALELVKDGENGYIVPVDDEETLANRIAEILQDEALRKNMANSSLKWIKEYTFENMVRAHIDLFEEK